MSVKRGPKGTPFPGSILLITDQYIWYVCVGLLFMYGCVLLCITFN